jgi:hypothetical protein
VDAAGDDLKIVDLVSGLVPAEILAAHGFILARYTKTTDAGVTSIIEGEAGRVGWIFVGLLILTVVAYLIGRGWGRPTLVDIPRLLIPPLAFVAWTALLGTSAMTPWILEWHKTMAVVSPENATIAAVFLGVLLLVVNAVTKPKTV